MSNVVAIIQARLNSSRFPAKTLEVLYDKPLLEHIIERVQASRLLKRIVVATTTQPADDAIVTLAKRLNVDVCRGSEANVLSRFHEAAVQSRAEVIVRITADDPFKDPEVIDRAIDLLLTQGYDYCSNTLTPSFPEGLDVEAFSFAALQTAFFQAKLDSEKEHVTPYIWKRPEKFSLHNFTHQPNLSQLRWTIDYEKDILFAREIYRRLYPRKRIFLMRDILDLLESEPGLSDLNSGVIRNEGYYLSVEQESNHE